MMSNGRDPPVSARTRSAASTGIISDALAAEIEEQFRLPVGHPNRQNDETVRANWRVLYQDWLNGKMNNLCRNRPDQWSRADASSSASTATALSARRFNGSILDVDGLSNVDLSTAASDMRRRIIGIINKDPGHFRAEIERRRQAQQQKQQQDKDNGKGPEQQQQPPPQQRALAQLRRAGAGGAGIAGSDFHSATQIDKRMDELLAQQEASLLEALRIECEMKALWWLKQRATQGPK